MSGAGVIKKQDAIFEYKVSDNASCKEVVIEKVTPLSSQVEIPEKIEGMTVTGIGKKAFLGADGIRQIRIASCVRTIDNWAFAHCKHLETLIIMNEKPELGRGVLDDSNAVKNICIGSEQKSAYSRLLASAIVFMDAQYLMLQNNVNKEDWFSGYDISLTSFINQDDDEGYTAMVLCGEEDILKNPVQYRSDKRKSKAYLCMLRLRNNDMLDELHEKLYKDYVINHSKGCRHDDAWQALLERFSDEIEYYKLFTELGAVNKDNIDDMLLDMQEGHAEAKAFLMKYKQENFGASDIFDSFCL